MIKIILFLNLLFISVFCSITEEQMHNQLQEKNYNIGEQVVIKCLNPYSNKWEQPIFCRESQGPLFFRFGIDHFSTCGWEINSDEKYQFFADVIEHKQHWMCRVPMRSNSTHYVPFYLPLWGITAQSHLHLDNHLNFIFHADPTGIIIGAAAYPIRDNFQLGKKGSIISMHGPIKWFFRGGYRDFSSTKRERTKDFSYYLPLFLLLLALTILIVFVSLTILYQFYLKPNIVLKTLKKHG